LLHFGGGALAKDSLSLIAVAGGAVRPVPSTTKYGAHVKHVFLARLTSP